MPSDIQWDILYSLARKIRSTGSQNPPRVTISTLGSVLEANEPNTDQSKHLNIRVLNHYDGQMTIAKAACRLKSLVENSASPETILRSDEITEELSHLYGSDPDLILVFGPQCCLYGFPPWQIKYSEMK